MTKIDEFLMYGRNLFSVHIHQHTNDNRRRHDSGMAKLLSKWTSKEGVKKKRRLLIFFFCVSIIDRSVQYYDDHDHARILPALIR
jgi:hypothetical protein